MQLFLCTALIATAFVGAFANIPVKREKGSVKSALDKDALSSLSLSEKQLKALVGAQIDVNVNKNGSIIQLPSFLSLNSSYDTGMGAGLNLIIPLPLGLFFPSIPPLNLSLAFNTNKNVSVAVNAGVDEVTTPAPVGWSGWAPSSTPGWAAPGWGESSTTPGWVAPGWGESSTTPGWVAPGWGESSTTPGWSSGWPAPPATGWAPPSSTPGWAPPSSTPGWAPPSSTPGWAPPSSTPGWAPPSSTPGWAPPSSTPGWSPPVTTPGWGPGWKKAEQETASEKKQEK